MTDNAVAPDGERKSRIGMQGGVILHLGALADLDHSLSPRSTAPNQTLESRRRRTLPITVAVSRRSTSDRQREIRVSCRRVRRSPSGICLICARRNVPWRRRIGERGSREPGARRLEDHHQHGPRHQTPDTREHGRDHHRAELLRTRESRGTSRRTIRYGAANTRNGTAAKRGRRRTTRQHLKARRPRHRKLISCRHGGRERKSDRQCQKTCNASADIALLFC